MPPSQATPHIEPSLLTQDVELEPSPRASDAMRDSLASRAKRSTFWVILNQVGGNGLRLGSNLILTRLLSPADFGLMAIVNLVLIGLHMITDVGINAAILSSPRGEEREFLRTAYAIGAMRGFVVMLMTLACAYPVALYAHDPRLVTMLFVTSLVPLIQGFGSTKHPSATRRMHLRGNILVELTAQVAQLVSTIAFALWLRDAWALVWGGIVQVVVWVAMSHLILEGPRDAFGWSREAASEIFHLAKWILVSSVTMFLASRFDVIVLARYISKQDLGVYGQALVIASLPFQLVNPLTDGVMLPAMSAVHRTDPAGYTDAIRRSRSATLSVIMLLVVGAGLAAPGFYYLLYRSAFHSAAWQAQLCLTGTWFLCMSETATRVTLAMGSAAPMAKTNVARFAISVVTVIAGYELYGLTGAILGATLSAACAHVVVLVALGRSGFRLGSVDAGFTLLAFGVLAFGAWVPHVVAPWAGVAWQLVSIGTGTLLLVPIGLLALRGLKRLQS